jgi:hypothetical protein
MDRGSAVRPFASKLWRALPLYVASLALAGLAVRHIASVARAIALRWGFPHPLEWMEGGPLLNAARLLAGEPLYTTCDHGFVSLPYPPVHFVALAGAGALFGLDYPSGRAVSIAALVACVVLLSREVWRAAPSQLSAEVMVLVAIGSIAAGYPIVDGWYDLIRVDMLFAALLTGAAVLCFSVPATRRHAIGAAVLLTLAGFTKQTAAIYVPWLALVLLLRNRAAAAWMVGVLLTLGGLCLAGLQLWTHGWFWQVNVSMLAAHQLIPDLTWRATKLFALYAPFLPMTVLLAVVAAWKGWLSKRSWPWLGMLFIAIPQSLWAASKVAAHINNLMMAVLLAGPVTVMVCADVARGLQKSGAWHRWATILAIGLCAAQLWLWDSQADRYIPSAAEWRRAQEINAFVAALPGQVIAPSHPFLPVRHGKGLDQPITQAYHDHGALSREVVDLVACMGQSPARWLVLNSGNPTPFMRGMAYRYFEPRVGMPHGPATLSGYGTRATVHLERRVDLPQTNRRILFDFESGNFDGWQVAGEAFEKGPLRSPHHIRGYGGRYVASSQHPHKWDWATGRLVSPEFEIDRDYLRFTIGGGRSHRASVELVVDGVQLRNALARRSDVMVPVLWDVYGLRGRTAQLRVVDEIKLDWGHVHLDDVVLFDSD